MGSEINKKTDKWERKVKSIRNKQNQKFKEREPRAQPRAPHARVQWRSASHPRPSSSTIPYLIQKQQQKQIRSNRIESSSNLIQIDGQAAHQILWRKGERMRRGARDCLGFHHWAEGGSDRGSEISMGRGSGGGTLLCATSSP